MNILRAVSERLRKKQEFHCDRISSYGICDAIFRADYPVEQANTSRSTDWILHLSGSAGSATGGLTSRRTPLARQNNPQTQLY